MAIDNTAPKETIIKRSKTKPLFENILWSILMMGCLYSYFVIDSGLRYLSIVLFCLFLKGVYENIKKYKKGSVVQFRLSNKGLTLKDGTLISWVEINDMKVIVKPNYSSKMQLEYLVVKTRKNKIEFFINELDISVHRLEYLIRIYRSRFEKDLLKDE